MNSTRYRAILRRRSSGSRIRRSSKDREPVHGRDDRDGAERRAGGRDRIDAELGLDDYNAPAWHPNRAGAAAQRVTRNLLTRMLATRGVPVPPRAAQAPSS